MKNFLSIIFFASFLFLLSGCGNSFDFSDNEKISEQLVEGESGELSQKAKEFILQKNTKKQLKSQIKP